MLVLRAVDGANRVSPFVLVILLLPFVGGFAQGNFRPLVAYLVWITFDSRTKDWKGAFRSFHLCHRDTGHQGRDRSLSLLYERFWWPKM